MTDTKNLKNSIIHIGWAETDITPDAPVMIQGQFHARVSEEILDRLTATVLALESGPDAAIFVSCDLVSISEPLSAAVRERLKDHVPVEKIILNATHTHTAPATSIGSYGVKDVSGRGVELPVQDAERTIADTAEKIAEAVCKAWDSRSPGAVAFGLGRAIISRNRRWVDTEGKSSMYGKIDHEEFSHIEGYEDHDLNLLATYGPEGGLTGLVVNVASPSQVREQLYALSADYWHETRVELRTRFGNKLFVLGQCAAAGDQAPFRIQEHIYNHRAEERMLKLKKRDACAEIAHRIADGVEEILPWIEPTRETNPVFRHCALEVELPFNPVSERDAEDAKREAAEQRATFERMERELKENPELKKQPRWYLDITKAHGLMRRHERVVERLQSVRTTPGHPLEIHLVRIGDSAMATNPFEYYLDYGIQIKARSPAVQTFLVQLSGPGSYVPSERSLKGGGYGSVPASNIFGPEAGAVLRERTLEELGKLWVESKGKGT